MKSQWLVPLTMVLTLSSSSYPGECKHSPATNDQTATTGNAMSSQTVADANTKFGLNILNVLGTEKPGENVFISPLSISIACSMALSGSAGATREALSSTLQLPKAAAHDLENATGQLIASYSTGGSKSNLTLANAMYANKQFSIKPDYVEKIENSFGAQVQTLDFGQSDSVTKINSWVKNKTHGKIAEITKTIDPSMASILLNAAYFKGQWMRTFNKQFTSEAPFHLPDGKTKNVAMMHETHSMGYMENDKCQAVGLPYEDGRYQAFVLLPKKGTSLSELERALTSSSWSNWHNSFNYRLGDLALPRFRIQYSTSLAAPLKSLGASIAFDKNKADFSVMHKAPPLFWIGDVKHKTFLSVDEYGTEAAAVTSVEMMGAGMPPPDKFKMVVDRPFLFIIGDEKTGTLLFIGQICQPG